MLIATTFALMVGTLFVCRNFLPLDEQDAWLRERHMPEPKTRWLVVIVSLIIATVITYNANNSSLLNERILNFFIGGAFLWSTLFDKLDKTLEPVSGTVILGPSIYQDILYLFIWVFSLVYPVYFIPFFTIGSLWYFSRFNSISATEIYMPHKVACYLISYYILSAFVEVPPEILIITLSAVCGVHYFSSGLGKYKIQWERVNLLGNIAHAAKNQNNWGLIADRSWFPLMQKLNVPLQTAVVYVEMAAVFSVIDYRLGLFCFGFLFLMHLGIFISTGIFFWKWMAVLVPVIFMIYGLQLQVSEITSNIPLVISYIIAIAFSYLLPSIPSLVWIDSPLSHKITWIIKSPTTESTYEINPYDVRPYDMSLSQGRLGVCYPSDLFNMMGCLGALKPPSSPEDIGEFLAHYANRLNVLSTKKLEEEQVRPAFLELYNQVKMYDNFLKDQELPDWMKKHKNDQLIRGITGILGCLEKRSTKRLFIPNVHIWNLKKKDDKSVLQDILSESSSILEIKRQVFFYSNYHNKSFIIHESQYEINIGNSEIG